MREVGTSSAVASQIYKLIMFDNTARIILRQRKKEVTGLSKLHCEIAYSVVFIK